MRFQIFWGSKTTFFLQTWAAHHLREKNKVQQKYTEQEQEQWEQWKQEQEAKREQEEATKPGHD